MKKLLLLFNLFLFAAVAGNAQLTEQKTTNKNWILYGQVKYVGPAKASLEYIVNDKDSTFLLMMWDERPELKTYFSIKFSSAGNAVESLYNILISFFEKENWKNKDYVKLFKLGDENVSVYKTSVIGTKTIMIKTDKGRIALRKGEIEKLFNKK